MENLIILGTGIAGCTAAVYAARANLKPLLISGPEDGGQLTLTTDVENFPGFPEGVKGPELVQLCKKQAERFGTVFMVDIVEHCVKKDNLFELKLVGGDLLQTKALIVATGASARWLGIPSEEKYKGRGVTTCATCDGAFFKDKEVVVIGGGDSAMEESTFLTKFASKVTIVHRKDSFRASKIMQERALKNPKIKVVWNSEIAEIIGDGKKVNGVKLKDTTNGAISDFKCDGVFLAIGHVPNTAFLKGIIDVDELGYIRADKNMHTNVEGLFAAGDVQDKRFRQAITAAGSGCMAAMEAEKYLAERGVH
ncbi:thioredoxin-disulfide reductase [Candidatus Woesearchaeota archaeon]|nr:thioredoxin-disulfide reductase [Candidatus Woesearchaeota archaeon]